MNRCYSERFILFEKMNLESLLFDYSMEYSQVDRIDLILLSCSSNSSDRVLSWILFMATDFIADESPDALF